MKLGPHGLIMGPVFEKTGRTGLSIRVAWPTGLICAIFAAC
jgi:hypothetical protein